jgi:GT2 family glycosyltransferase
MSLSNTNPQHIAPPDDPYLGFFDSMESGLAEGWAYHPNRPEAPTRLRVLIDGKEVTTITCNLPRADVQRHGHPTGDVGFEYEIPSRYQDGIPHRIEFLFPNGAPVHFHAGGQVRFSRTFTLAQIVYAQGTIDVVANGVVRGWVLRADRPGGPLTGQCEIEITSNGVFVARAIANRHRPDVAGALNCDPNCGFHVYIPFAFRKPQFREFRCFVLPTRVEVGNSPCPVSDPPTERIAKLQDLQARIERLHADIVGLRHAAGQAAFEQPWNVGDDYDSWARRHAAALRARMDMHRKPNAPQPLVSVICPTYRPRLSNFLEAVESVRLQTYQNWELIIINDGSGQEELSAAIARLAEQDKRIQVIDRKKNTGISGATNAGLAAARGEWIALFDHDDLLSSVALEMMIGRVIEANAKVVYSDEDKITDAGYFLEPAFKPDWNHRLVLGSNYVCHLLIIRADIVSQTGKFDSKFDGAQDHDFVLRVAEIVPPDEILHIPEILYHWRMSAGSTALSTANKRYAIDAGINCVRAHLARRGLQAEVSSLGDTTRYRVLWQQTETPSVAIIVPFREHVDMTRRSVERTLASTAYENYSIILVDNGSSSEEAKEFVHEITQNSRVSAMRVDEPFNFARLCNLAAYASEADFYLFMNNDIFVETDSWLSRALDEALVDPKVGIVGGKFLYPDRTIQHGGVALGIGAVAGHMHTGLVEDHPGYMSRAVLAQELSAVTGAAMVVRASVFKEIGGFDEFHLQVDYNDIDLCLKARAAGHKVIWTPEFQAEHHESISRGSSTRPDQEERFFLERQTMIRRWAPLIARDPYYNENFDLMGAPFCDLVAPGVWPKPPTLV